MKLSLTLTFIAFFSLSACTLYQSENRKSIQKGSDGTFSATVFAEDERMSCYYSQGAPDYFNKALEVLKTNYDELGFSFYRSQEGDWMVVYLESESLKRHYSCEFQKAEHDWALQGVEIIQNHIKNQDL
jgi:hypothetical protein